MSQPGTTRNIAIIGHSGSGKTSLTDALAFTSGIGNRLGRVNDETSLSDFLPEEKERKNSITSSIFNVDSDGTEINFIDCPGYADFVGSTYEAVRVADGAIVVINAFNGVETGTQKKWRLLEERNIPRIIFVNHLDNENVNYDTVIADIKEKLGNNAVQIQLPVNPGDGFNAYVDLLEKKTYTSKGGEKEAYDVSDVPANMSDAADTAYLSLMELAAEGDDALMEKYFESGELTHDEMEQGLNAGVAAGKTWPVVVGSATNLVGISALKKTVAHLIPAATAGAPAVGTKPGSEDEETRPVDPSAPFSAFVFKMSSEEHLGDVYTFKVISGQVKSGDDVINSTRDGKERMGQIFLVQGHDRKEVPVLSAGQIGAVVKLKNTHIGDTLCAGNAPVVYPPITFPEAIVDQALVSHMKGAEEKIGAALNKLSEEDPTFTYRADPELHQTIINGMGEVQVEIYIKRMKEQYKLDVELTKPNIPYKETIRKPTQGHKKYKKQSGGRGQFGEVFINLLPKPHGEGFEFVNKVVGGAIPGKFIPSVEKGIRETLPKGPLAGYQVVDVAVELYDGKYHEVDSSEASFKMAGSMAFKEAFGSGNPVLLEPIYDVEIRVPEDHMGDVMGDLSGRRGKIAGMEADKGMQVIKAQVPLPELYRYSTSLRSLTSGAGEFSRKFSHYEEVPRDQMDKVVAEAVKQNEEA